MPYFREGLLAVACRKAAEAIEMCSTHYGLFASAGKDGYTSVWGRDSMVSLTGASFHTKKFKAVFGNSLKTLAKYQTKLGQIPNAVDLYDNSRQKQVTFATIDSGLWFVIGEYFYRKHFGKSLWRKHHKNIEAAMRWVSYQDSGNDLMPEQLPTSDWQDCFPHKYGHTINTQALYYAALSATGNRKILPKLKKQIDKYLFDSYLGYYLPWHWKDHNEYKEKEEWFDSLGNMLAIVFGLADSKQQDSILDFVEEHNVAKPFPVKAIHPPIQKDDREWKDYFTASDAGEPGSYLNGGIWPYIGGFYVAALVEAKRFDDAEKNLELLAKANKIENQEEWGFSEWIHPARKTGEGSHHQAWSAGCFLLAYECVKRKKNLLRF